MERVTAIEEVKRTQILTTENSQVTPKEKLTFLINLSMEEYAKS